MRYFYVLIMLGMVACNAPKPRQEYDKVVAFINEAYLEWQTECNFIDSLLPPTVEFYTHFVNYGDSTLLLPLNSLEQTIFKSKLIGVNGNDTIALYMRKSLNRPDKVLEPQNGISYLLEFDNKEIKKTYDPKKHWEYRAFLVDFIQNARFKFVHNAQDTSSQYLIPQKMPVIISKKRKIHSFTGADKQLEPYVD